MTPGAGTGPERRDVAVEVRALTKRYGPTTAVDRITFAIPRGTITALLGGNGAGKTTTLAMLLGLVKPSGGEIEVLGVDMLRARHRALGRMNFSSPYVELLGLPLVGFFVSLLAMGWALGIAVSGVILRFGLGAESLAWVAVFALAPLSGVWYPISVLPGWLQPVAAGLPSSHVFEGMRAILIDGVFRADLMVHAIVLDLVYLAVAVGLFTLLFEQARRDGQLLQLGE